MLRQVGLEPGAIGGVPARDIPDPTEQDVLDEIDDRIERPGVSRNTESVQDRTGLQLKSHGVPVGLVDRHIDLAEILVLGDVNYEEGLEKTCCDILRIVHLNLPSSFDQSMAFRGLEHVGHRGCRPGPAATGRLDVHPLQCCSEIPERHLR